MSHQQTKKRTEGFTIIEVLIVLAIAGLIMLIVFLAVPALQRNSRNNARNNDASRIASAVTECLSNRNGTITSCDTLTATNGVPAATSEIQPGTLTQLVTIGGTASTTQGVLTFGTGGGGCDATGQNAAAGASTRSFSLVYQLEPAGVTNQRCISG